MTVHIVLTIARQIQGEMIFVKTEKGFLQAAKADEYAQKLKSDFTNSDGTLKELQINTPQGSAICSCTVGAFTVEVEE